MTIEVSKSSVESKERVHNGESLMAKQSKERAREHGTARGEEISTRQGAGIVFIAILHQDSRLNKLSDAIETIKPKSRLKYAERAKR